MLSELSMMSKMSMMGKMSMLGMIRTMSMMSTLSTLWSDALTRLPSGPSIRGFDERLPAILCLVGLVSCILCLVSCIYMYTIAQSPNITSYTQTQRPCGIRIKA